MSSPSSSSSPLARFPIGVQNAYDRFLAKRDPADLRIVVEAAVRDFMPKRQTFPAEAEIPDASRLIDDLGFDSLAVAETVFFFEDLFKVSIQNEEILALQTVGDLRAFVERKFAAQTTSA